MTLFVGLDLLDGNGLRPDMALLVEDGIVRSVEDRAARQGEDLSRGARRALVCPGLVDLQVNGGGGWMLGDCRTADDILQIVAAHRATGTTHLMPTLISDSPETTRRIADLLEEAQARDPSILGLHLEGPHLGVAGAHDAAMLRPMSAADLAFYVKLKARLGAVILTVAPEIVPADQIAVLAQAGVTVSLGHSNSDYDMGMASIAAGARMVTHLFNAMSGLHHRAPGLVGAGLDGAPAFGLIADGVHVHPAALRLAMRARPEAGFLVTDAMAVAGTTADSYRLAGKTIHRREGRLETADGTLAGADLTLVQAARNLARWTGAGIADTLPLAFDRPWRLMTGGPNLIAPGRRADLLRFNGDALTGRLDGDVWIA